MSWLRPVIALSLIAAFAGLSLAHGAPSPQELCDAAEPVALTPMQFEQAEQVLEPDTDYRAILCTSAGAVYVDLTENRTPVTVNSFVFLAQQGFYDSTTFHRVIPKFMAQGGDPTGTGRGGPGYRFQDEPIRFVTFDQPGLLAMANSGPHTNGSQFFITTAPTPHLNYKHTIFGYVLVGQDIVEAISERDPQAATEPGETLHTILIITDPSQVDDSAVIPPQPVVQEDLLTAFARFKPEELTVMSSDDRREALPSGLQDRFAMFAERYSHDYHIGMRIHNADCDPEAFYTSVGYAVDVFAGAEDAVAALADDLWVAIAESEGFIQPDQARSPIFIKDTQSCHSADGLHVMAQHTVGRFVITVDILVDLGIVGEVDPASLIMSVTNQLEVVFEDVYSRELR